MSDGLRQPGVLADSRSIVVLGAGGQLGSWLCELLGEQASPFDLPALDVTDRAAVWRMFKDVRPTAIFNCAAYTAVDRAEREPERCRAVNATSVEYLAEIAAKLDGLLVQISTDYVFGVAPEAPRPWREDDEPRPRGVYAESKRAGELAAMRAPRHLIVRTCGLYGHADPNAQARNFVEAILAKTSRGEELRVVHDQRCSPSFAREVADRIAYLYRSGQTGTFHVTSEGATTWFEFAQAIVNLTGSKSKVIPISTAEYAAAAHRPVYSVLDTSKYAAAGGPPMPTVMESLRHYLAWRATNVKTCALG